MKKLLLVLPMVGALAACETQTQSSVTGAAAGAAVGSVVPIIGTAGGALVGGAIGGFVGSEAGGWLGEKLGALVDRLSSPDAVAREVVNNSDNRSITFAPQLTVQPSGDESYDKRLADRMMQRLRAEMVPLMMGDPLAVRRGAALTDGSE